MKISEAAQEQLEQLWSMMHENDAQWEQTPGRNSGFRELVEANLVKLADGTASLTETGQVEAAMAIRRHRLAERLLADVLITEDDLIDERACGVEHALFDGVDESICTLLGHPQFCPHGKPIPPGKCCEQMLTSVDSLIAPLTECKRGQAGRIAYLHTQQPQRLQKLMAMGILPGAAIRIKETYPSYVFEAGFSQFAIDEETASDIFIRKAVN